MNDKKLVSQILVFIVLLVIVIVGILVKINVNNNSTPNNNDEYANLNINQEELNIFYLNVGQADSTFITINGYNMLIDSGNEQDGYYIWQFLKAQNITKLDYFIVTHFDEDHMGGAYKILEEMNIGILYMPNNSYKHPDEETLERLQNHSSILQIYRTDEDGTIWLTSSGNEINIEKIKYNLDGTGRKHASILKRKYLYAFFLRYRISVFKPNYMV